MIQEEMIPARIKKIRMQCKMTQQELANAVGVTKGYISKIENGMTAPPVGTLIAFAQAMRVELNAFFEHEAQDVYFTVTKKNQRPSIAHDNQGKYEHLALNFPRRAFESYIIKTPSRGITTKPHKHTGQEMIMVLKGRIDFYINGHNLILEEGDVVHFNSSYMHYGKCLSEDGSEIMGVIYNGMSDIMTSPV